MTHSRVFAGRFDDLALDPDGSELLVTVKVPIPAGGPLLAELARCSEGLKNAPVTISTGRFAQAIGILLGADGWESNGE